MSSASSIRRDCSHCEEEGEQRDPDEPDTDHRRQECTDDAAHCCYADGDGAQEQEDESTAFLELAGTRRADAEERATCAERGGDRERQRTAHEGDRERETADQFEDAGEIAEELHRSTYLSPSCVWSTTQFRKSSGAQHPVQFLANGRTIFASAQLSRADSRYS